MYLLKIDKKEQEITKIAQDTKPRTFPTNQGSLTKNTCALSEQM